MVEGSRVKWQEPIDLCAQVNERSGALAGWNPFALRFHFDAFQLNPLLQRASDLFRNRNPVTLANRDERHHDFGFESERRWFERHSEPLSYRLVS